jgi:hypothetical protein
MQVVRAIGASIVALMLATGAAHATVAEAPPKVNNDNGPPIQFYTDLSADEESAITDSPGKGHIEFVLERKTLKLSWKLTYANLTSPPTSVSLHGPQTPGGNAGVVVNLSPKGVTNPLEGEAIINDGILAYLMSDRLYVNLFTTKYKDGELRGQLKRRRPEDVKPRT